MHKGPRVRLSIEAAGANLLYLLPYSPDLSPVDYTFSKLQALLRIVEERKVTGLWDNIGRIIDMITPAECANYL